MSSGGSLPYHLRQNKATDRGLFVDLLLRLNKIPKLDISSYSYISLGGPFLEDFKMMHDILRIKSMQSIEMDQDTIKRQCFNKPYSCINLSDNPITTSEFINLFTFTNKSIVWLDYTMPAKINEQLSDVRLLVSKLSAFDVVKVTFNANPSSLGDVPDKANLNSHRANILSERLGSYIPEGGCEDGDVTRKKYPSTLLRALEIAVKGGLEGKSTLDALPISTFSYEDGQQMMTATFLIIESSCKDYVLKRTKLDKWPFYTGNWSDVKKINVPTLSIRERLLIESMLPNGDLDEINERLGYPVGPEQSSSDEMIENFIKLYQLAPWFLRMSL